MSAKVKICIALLIGQEKSPESPFCILDRFTVIEIAKMRYMPIKIEEDRFKNQKVIVYRDQDTNKLHNVGDEPAVIWADGSRFWYKNGRYHRDGDEPAIIYANGSRYWYKNGLQHRDGDEPAIMCANGVRHWCKNGAFMR
jgi:hypothetical protein